MMETKNNPGQLLNEKACPSMTEELNKDYVIDRETINAEDMDLLCRYGYTIYHRPNFAMKGMTRKKVTLNPYLKNGRDAGEKEKLAMSFQEYFELFINSIPS